MRIASILLFLLSGVAAHAATLSLGFSPNTTTVETGSTFRLNVVAQGELGAYDLWVTYGPSIILQNITFGSALGGDPLGQMYSTFTGSFAEYAVIPPAELAALQGSGTYTLVTLTFQALSAGVSDILLNYIDVTDYNGQQFDSVSIGTASVTVNDPDPGSPVPEPSTIALSAIALGAGAFLRHKRQQ